MQLAMSAVGGMIIQNCFHPSASLAKTRERKPQQAFFLMILYAFRVTFRSPAKMPHIPRHLLLAPLWALLHRILGFQVVLFDMRWSILYLWGTECDEPLFSGPCAAVSVKDPKDNCKSSDCSSRYRWCCLHNLCTCSITIWYKLSLYIRLRSADCYWLSSSLFISCLSSRWSSDLSVCKP